MRLRDAPLTTKTDRRLSPAFFVRFRKSWSAGGEPVSHLLLQQHGPPLGSRCVLFWTLIPAPIAPTFRSCAWTNSPFKWWMKSVFQSPRLSSREPPVAEQNVGMTTSTVRLARSRRSDERPNAVSESASDSSSDTANRFLAARVGRQPRCRKRRCSTCLAPTEKNVRIRHPSDDSCGLAS